MAGEAVATKVCTNCGEEKSVDDFHRDRYRPDGRTQACKPCRTSKAAAWNRRNPDRHAANVSAWRQRHPEVNRARMAKAHVERYGITYDAYLEMLAVDRCPVCHGPMYDAVIDHDHSCCPSLPACGRCVRGVVCRRCNSGIGMLGDDPEVAERAMDWLTLGGTLHCPQ